MLFQYLLPKTYKITTVGALKRFFNTIKKNINTNYNYADFIYAMHIKLGEEYNTLHLLKKQVYKHVILLIDAQQISSFFILHFQPNLY